MSETSEARQAKITVLIQGRSNPLQCELTSGADQYSIYEPSYTLADTHRWSKTDVGKKLVAIEQPDGDGKSLVTA